MPSGCHPAPARPRSALRDLVTARDKVTCMAEQRRWLRPVDAAALPEVNVPADTLRKYARSGYLPYSTDPPIVGARGWWEDEFRAHWAARKGQGRRTDLQRPRWLIAEGGRVAHLVSQGTSVCGREITGTAAPEEARHCKGCAATEDTSPAR